MTTTTSPQLTLELLSGDRGRPCIVMVYGRHLRRRWPAIGRSQPLFVQDWQTDERCALAPEDFQAMMALLEAVYRQELRHIAVSTADGCQLRLDFLWTDELDASSLLDRLARDLTQTTGYPVTALRGQHA